MNMARTKCKGVAQAPKGMQLQLLAALGAVHASSDGACVHEPSPSS